MKKKMIWIVSIIAIIAVGTYIAATVMINIANYDASHKDDEPAIVTETVEAAPEEAAPEEGTPEEIEQQTGYIGDVKSGTGLGENPEEWDVIQVMHEMTHQKVRAYEKRGAIEMTAENVNEVYEIVSKSNYDHKEELLAILDKWKKGDFKTADEDHNYFWGLQGGEVGQAYGVLSSSEEQTFVENNFR